MRQWWSWRTWAALAVAVGILVVAAIAVTGTDQQSTGETLGQPTERRIELVASVMSVASSEDFAVAAGTTIGSATLALDDGRVVSIVRDTPGEINCSDFGAPAACVLLADMLGEGVVWFALVTADSSSSRILTLPTLVDMVDGGDTGVLENGWYVPLANGVVRTCAGAERSPTLRAFINSYSQRGIRTLLDLDRDQVVEVICLT